MKRRTLLAGAVLALPLARAGIVTAQGTATGYETLAVPQNTGSGPDRVEVLEYFWFGCPHCFAFEPTIEAWAATRPAHVDFVREAPPLNPSWMPHSQAFYAAETLGITDAMFDALFDAIHVERRPLRAPEAIAAFVGELGIDGVDEARFLATMTSFAVQTRIRAAMAKARAAEISGVPAIVVDGRYRTSGRLAGSNDRVIEVIETLSARERAG